LPVDQVSDLLSSRSTNVLSLVYANVYFPTYSNGLKEICNYLGFEWSFPDATGLKSIIWREQWESSHDPAIKDRLLIYNKEDCLALKKLTDFLSTIPEHSDKRDPIEDGIRFIEEIRNDDVLQKLGRQTFAIDEFSEITERSYFDYQRDKVYIRTNPDFSKIQRRKRKARKQQCSLRPNKIVNLRANKCPKCTSRNIARDNSRLHERDSLDLRISRGGTKRWVTHYRTPYHECNDCGKKFIPKSFKKKTRFGHGLISWAIDQHVGNRITFENLERTIKNYFSLPIDYIRFYEIKTLAAKYYSETNDKLLKKLISGSIIHADETKINLQKDSGYVWVFTNMEEVVYLFKPSREADFLGELLAGFKGVLITDFYSGYDSLPCLQQKCLIHLIRDVNEDLLKNPFDQELREVATLFGKLIRSIIETVDRVGLKSRYLSKHKNDANAFINGLTKKSFESEIAGKYSKRIVKNQSKLFTFLDHDGVPWNNNNAEHAIKYFAKYRNLTNGRVTARGLRSYLILLSIYQTCRYKEIQFLDFLLSKERDIDYFAAGT